MGYGNGANCGGVPTAGGRSCEVREDIVEIGSMRGDGRVSEMREKTTRRDV